MNIHQNIKEKLNNFIKSKKIPNIIFYGPPGGGKRTIVRNFIKDIYGGDVIRIKSYVMYVNCAHGKGIKFIREELKYFAKTHINNYQGDVFKSIILLNADKLTFDAQSALRRCIEQFSHTTRFFIIVENKNNLLKPIISRFCEIFISEPNIDGKIQNLHTYNLKKTFNNPLQAYKIQWLKKTLDSYETKTKITINNIVSQSIKLYEKGYSGLDIMNYIEQYGQLENEKKYEFLICFNKVRKEFRNEKILILFILNFYYLRSDSNLENISFM